MYGSCAGGGCRTGSLCPKPTCLPTNIPWTLNALCDEVTRPHRHVPLVGAVADFLPDAGKDTAWYSPMAAEFAKGLRDSVKKWKPARDLGVSLRRALKRALKIPEVCTAMNSVVNGQGTERAACPHEAVAGIRKVLCKYFYITIYEDIGEGKCSNTRSCYFAKLWKKLLEESGDPESDSPRRLKCSVPVGGKRKLKRNGVLWLVEAGTAAVESRNFSTARQTALQPCAAPTTAPSTTPACTQSPKARVLLAGFLQGFGPGQELNIGVCAQGRDMGQFQGPHCDGLEVWREQTAKVQEASCAALSARFGFSILRLLK